MAARRATASNPNGAGT